MISPGTASTSAGAAASPPSSPARETACSGCETGASAEVFHLTACATPHPVMAEVVTRWRALGLRCVICDGRIESGGVVLLGREPHHRGCAVTAAAGIASEVIEGDDSYTARDVQAAAGILADAARVLAAKCGGRA